MAEVKSGVNYEITADDKASAVADKASKNVQKSSKEAGEAFKGEFNPMSAVLAGISGNTQALAQQMLGLVSRMKSVHMTMMKFSLYAALVMAIVKAVGVLMEKFAEARTKADQIKLDKAAGALENCNKEQARLNEQLDQAREKSSQIHSNLMSELDATQKLTAARREYTKALELSLAKTEEEKAAIERRHAAEGAKDKIGFDAQRNKAKREKTLSDIASWEEQIRDYEDTLAMQRKSAKWAQNAQASAGKRIKNAKWFWHFGLDDDKEIVENAGATHASAVEGIQNSIKAIEELRAKIETARIELENLNKSDEELDLQRKTENLKAQEAEKEAKKAAEAKLKVEKAAAEKLQAEKTRDAQKAAEAEAKAIKDAQLKANREVMDQRRKDLAALTDMETQASARLAAAQSKVAEAWGWYRDKDKMAAVMAEEKADAKAREQYEKDFEKLRSRRDWRTAKDLSVDQEAVRRVALAKEEETAAQKALAETAKSTAQAAASLAEIEKVITQEG